MIINAQVSEKVKYVGNTWKSTTRKGPNRELTASFDRELCDTGVIENIIMDKGRPVYVEVRMDPPNFGLQQWKASDLVRVMVK